MSESTIIFAAYAFYQLAAIAAVQLRPLAPVCAILFIGGWLLLPVAHYPADTITASHFTVNVIGAALPSNLGVTKAWVIPVAIIVAITVKSPRIWLGVRLGWLDVAVVLFCAWPLIAAVATGSDMQTAIFSCLYLAGTWGGSWAIGRLLAVSEHGRERLLKTIAYSGIALLPFAIVEGLAGPMIYTSVYGDHPFLLEGAQRYVGYRPLGFFEHGNQFGMWMAMSAFSWWVLAKGQMGNMAIASFGLVATTLAALASQSVGAILLLAAGVAMLFLSARALRAFGFGMLVFAGISGAVYVSGAVPVEHIARNTALGQKAIEVVRASGRGSIGYRVRRDQMALAMLYRRPLAGYGTWDWWRPLGSHPWGLPLLVFGQFGVVALLLTGLMLLWAPVKTVMSADATRTPLAIIAILAAIDAGLNSYMFFPAMLCSAAIIKSRHVGIAARRATAV